jgi:hypothetical protein
MSLLYSFAVFTTIVLLSAIALLNWYEFVI